MSSTHIFVLLIIITVIASGLIKTWMGNRSVRSVNDGEFENMLGKIDALEERIRVLERIVTENRMDLKQQIDSL